jgi:uncharacterized protein with NRDE domain
MCLALFALDAHPAFALVVAANRDEYHVRPAAPAAWWEEGWLGGRDLAAGGTWLGVTRAARWAFVTNFRDPRRNNPAAPTRGTLVPALLADPAPPAESLARVIDVAADRNGFNLVSGLGAEAHWGSNRAGPPRALPPAIYGLSNAALDTPWPKLTRTKITFAAWCARGDDNFAAVFALLSDRTRAPDELLPSTGIPREREQLLSAPFIVDDSYGTRCSTVFTVDRRGQAHFVERTFDRKGDPIGDVEHRFAIATAATG